MMKKLYFLVLILITSVGFSYAQFTITKSNLPLKHSTAFYYKDSLPFATITEGNKGPKQTWDLSLLVNMSQDSVPYIDTTGLSHASNFPLSNYVSAKDSTHNFLQLTDSNCVILGQVTGIGKPIVYNKPARLFKFPMTYNDSTKDTVYYKTKNALDPGRRNAIKQYFGKNYDSTRTTVYVLRTNILDGYGTVIIPTDTFKNVMRMFRLTFIVPVSEFRDSLTGIWEKNTVLSKYTDKKDSTITYEWFSQNYRSPVASLLLKGSDQVLKSGSYLTQIGKMYNGIYEHVANKNNANIIYPNPSSDNITFNLNASEASVINIYDITGKLKSIINISPQANTVSYNISELNKGTYLFKILNDKKQLITTGKFTVNR